MTPLLHPKSKQVLDHLSSSLPQSLLLFGPVGVGLQTIATWLAGRHDTLRITPSTSPSGTKTIPVDAVRSLYTDTRTRRSSPLFVIIDDAESMSLAAANAFLKLLEEPTDNTHFILTSHHSDKLLPTVRSRLQAVAIQPVTPDQTTRFLTRSQQTDATKLAQLRFLADGLPAELSRLLASDRYFADQAAAMSDARLFLQGTTLDKLQLVKRYQENAAAASKLLDNVLVILSRTAATKPSPDVLIRSERALRAYDNIVRHASPRLQLLSLVL